MVYLSSLIAASLAATISVSGYPLPGHQDQSFTLKNGQDAQSLNARSGLLTMDSGGNNYVQSPDPAPVPTSTSTPVPTYAYTPPIYARQPPAAPSADAQPYGGNNYVQSSDPAPVPTSASAPAPTYAYAPPVDARQRSDTRLVEAIVQVISAIWGWWNTP